MKAVCASGEATTYRCQSSFVLILLATTRGCWCWRRNQRMYKWCWLVDALNVTALVSCAWQIQCIHRPSCQVSWSDLYMQQYDSTTCFCVYHIKVGFIYYWYMYTVLAWTFFELFAICETPFNRKLGKKKIYAIGAGLVVWLAVFIVNSISRFQGDRWTSQKYSLSTLWHSIHSIV